MSLGRQNKYIQSVLGWRFKKLEKLDDSDLR